jgi:hypothetical protein
MTMMKVMTKVLIYMTWLLVCVVLLLFNFLQHLICLDDGLESIDIADTIAQTKSLWDDGAFWAENNCVRILLYRIEVECHQPIVLPIGPNVGCSYLFTYFYCSFVAI